MITSPSRNDLVTGSIRLHDADVPVKAVKIPTAPTAPALKPKKTRKTADLARSTAVAICEMRAMMAVNTDRTNYLQTVTL
jgi:hypothetical protein